MTEEEFVVVHGDVNYLGGDYDEETGRTHFGEPWEDKIDAALEEYESATAVTTMDRAGQLSTDHPAYKRPRQLKDYTRIPYSHGKFDKILEDDNSGALDDDQLEEITSETDEVTVAGVYLNDCVSRLIDSLLAHDPEIEVNVDLEYTGLKRDTKGPKGLGSREEILDRSIEDIEREKAESPSPVLKNGEIQDKEALKRFESRYSENDRVDTSRKVSG